MESSKAKVAVVTGATRGIGRAIAASLAASGMRVVVAGRDAALGEEAAREIGGGASFRRLDLERADEIDAFVAAITSGGGLDVLVDNAGASFDGFDAGVARRTLDVNFARMMELTDRLLPAIHAGGRIVMVSSGMGQLDCLSPALREAFLSTTLDRSALVALADRFVADVRAGTHAKSGWPSNAYRVSKVAMNAYVRILARDLERDPRRILVNAACPGWVRTQMGGKGAPRSPAEGARTPAWLAQLPEGGPSGGFFRDERPIAW